MDGQDLRSGLGTVLCGCPGVLRTSKETGVQLSTVQDSCAPRSRVWRAGSCAKSLSIANIDFISNLFLLCVRPDV